MEKRKTSIEIDFNFFDRGVAINLIRHKHVKNKTQSIFYEMISDEIEKILRKSNHIEINEKEINLDDEIFNKKLDELIEDLKEIKKDIENKEK